MATGLASSNTDNPRSMLAGVHPRGSVEVELCDDDDASTSAHSTESDSSSLSSGILDYEYENGRRYHSFREVRVQRLMRCGGVDS